jgi:hypothetical protein
MVMTRHAASRWTEQPAPTREYADLVSLITETIERMVHANPMILRDSDQVAESPSGPYRCAPAYLFDYEKIVWHYPDAPARLIEE